MNSLTQYIELFDANRDTINAHAAEPMNRLRDRALDTLRDARFPDRSDEGFEKTSINDMFAPDFGLNISRVNLPVDIAATFRCDVPNMSTLLGIVANDKFVPTDTLVRNIPNGVKVMSLAEAMKSCPELVEDAYATVAPLDNVGVAFNTLFVQDGVFIHIGRGVRCEKPIQIVNIFNSATPLLAVRRVLIVAEPDSKVNVLVCDHSKADGVNYLSSQVVEIVCRSGSEVEYSDIEESSADTSRYSQMFVRQENGSSFKSNTSTLLNGSTRNEFNIAIEGEHCSCGLYGMAIGSGKQHIDNLSSVTHAAPRSASNQLFKYVLDDDATGAFEGGIEVTPAAPFTEAYQSNNNILASEGARMHSKPQLLIYNDDVKCSHGATTGQLNNEAMFYMQARGIPFAEARTMLMQAFMVDVINTLSLEGVRDRLRHLVEKRFDGTLGACHTCRQC